MTDKAKAALKNYCKEHGERFTAPREYVLEIIASASKPLTAYDALEELSKKLDNPKPPTAYRALEFLQEHGFIHRIESLNAYIYCSENHRHHGSQFMICDECGRVEEIHLCHMPEGLSKQAQAKNFHPDFWNLELHGKCGDCI